MNVLVAGATGALGRQLVSLLLAAGHSPILLLRSPQRVATLPAGAIRIADLTKPPTLDGICRGAEAVISCAGASLQLNLAQPASFHDVDYLGNLNLLAEARRAGVGKFVYVSAAGDQPLAHTAYVQAHERFVSALRQSGLAHTIVRPTGFFYMFASFLPLAARGFLPMAGDGSARTNPIHEADAAEACLTALGSPLATLEVGGPEVFTRLRLLELAFEAQGRIPHVKRAPGILMRAPLLFLKPIHPRLHALLEFGLAVSETDVIAPRFGRRRIGEYLRAEAERGFRR